MRSHSVFCHPGTVEQWLSRHYPSQSWYSIYWPRRDARLSWPRWWLHPKIVYLPKTVTYLRNNQALSWPGLKPATRKSQVQRPNHYTTEPPIYIFNNCQCCDIHLTWHYSVVIYSVCLWLLQNFNWFLRNIFSYYRYLCTCCHQPMSCCWSTCCSCWNVYVSRRRRGWQLRR